MPGGGPRRRRRGAVPRSGSSAHLPDDAESVHRAEWRLRPDADGPSSRATRAGASSASPSSAPPGGRPAPPQNGHANRPPGDPVLTSPRGTACDCGMEDASTPATGPRRRRRRPRRARPGGHDELLDREFPEWARVLMLGGAELILAPNACGPGRRRLGQVRARADETWSAARSATPLPGELVQSPARSSLSRCRLLPAGREQTELLEPAQGLVQRPVARQGTGPGAPDGLGETEPWKAACSESAATAPPRGSRSRAEAGSQACGATWQKNKKISCIVKPEA